MNTIKLAVATIGIIATFAIATLALHIVVEDQLPHQDAQCIKAMNVFQGDKYALEGLSDITNRTRAQKIEYAGRWIADSCLDG